MKRPAIFAVFATSALILTSVAIQAQMPQPYAGLETRPIKALSDQQIADLKEGRGMGLALAAELNGYPGPVHVLELAEPLGLSMAQRTRMQGLLEAMKAETIPLGEKLIVEESALDRQFATRTVTEASLAASTQAIGSVQAALRAAHLKYHLGTVAALTPVQVARYAELRGYAASTQAGPAHGMHRH
jgi:hypothetical protein